MLTIYRRHLRSCDHRAEGRAYRRCKCPVWADGFLAGVELREALKTRDWQKAAETVREWEARGSRKEKQVGEPVTIQHACDQFLRDAAARELREPTLYKYRLLFRRLEEFARECGLRYIGELDLERVRGFRAGWPDRNLAAMKNLERLRAFFRFCQDGDWITDNPARKLKNPKITNSPTLPFSREQVANILEPVAIIPIVAMRPGCVRSCFYFATVGSGFAMPSR
ncbi:MAG: hypothetical protein DMG96_41410 [Acidobacteria bacterium]|nr:MAG: hypothetical protein DMG96_41410 [Acidobacteriota bacterium]